MVLGLPTDWLAKTPGKHVRARNWLADSSGRLSTISKPSDRHEAPDLKAKLSYKFEAISRDKDGFPEHC